MGSSRRRDSRSPSPSRRRRRSRSRSPDRERRRRSRSTSRDRRPRSASPDRKRRRSASPQRDRSERHPESSRRGDRDRRRSRSPDRRDRGGGRDDEPSRRRDEPRAEQPPAAPAADAAGAADASGAAAGDGEAAAAPRRALTGRAGGVYIPPFKLARMMQEVNDKASPEYQRMTWDALRKSLNGLINKVNAANIKSILPELFQENLVRGQGLICKSLIKSQVASPSFTPVYAALVAVINTKLPEIGELLLHRVVNQFKRAYKRNDKPMAIAMTKFVAHLVNQAVVGELLALEIMILVLENPSEDGVEVVVEFTKEVGAHLQDVAPQGLMSVFERFRAILHEGEIDKRVQFMIENLFAIRKAGFAVSGHPGVKPELDLVEAEDQITHDISLNDQFADRNELNVFRVDEEYDDHEKQWAAVMREILGQEDSDSEGGSGGGSSEEEEEGSDEEEEDGEPQQAPRMDIVDATETNVVNLRRTIYLTIMSSMSFEESGHKLLTVMKSAPGHEGELVTMVIECSSQERTYLRYYGNLAQRFCLLDRKYQEHFAQRFADQYALIHRLETNKLRNTAKLFAHLLATDSLPWGVLECIRLTEDDTTSSSRIFIKYLFQDLSENMGLMKLNERLNDPDYQQWFDGIFPKDTQQNVRFAINFFTSIGLGGITDQMREYYKNMPKNLPPPPPPPPPAGGGGSSSSSSDDSSSSSSSGSDSDSDSDSDSSSGSGSSSSSGSDSSSSDSESESEDERKRRRRRR